MNDRLDISEIFLKGQKKKKKDIKAMTVRIFHATRQQSHMEAAPEKSGLVLL